jgi:hypothetical protein
MNAHKEPLGRFEERLLDELRRVVAERPSPAAAEATSTPAARWRRRPLALLGGLAAAAAAAALVGVALSGDDGTAWAVERNADGTVTVRIDSLSDADGLERKLAAEGVPAMVQYLPAGKACAGAPGTGAPFPRPAAANGGLTEERGLNEAPAGAGDYSLDRAGTPTAGEPSGGAVETLIRSDEDGGVEFTIDSARSPGEILVITSQTLPAGPGATVDGTALSIEYVKGEARPCEVVDAPR